MKFHWPLFIIVTLGICLVVSTVQIASAASPKKDVMITSDIGNSPADEEAYGEYMNEIAQQNKPYLAPQADIGEEIEQQVGGQMGQSISETMLPGSETDEGALPTDWDEGKK